MIPDAFGFPNDNLYFSNLPHDMTEETIREIFGAIGKRVVQCKMMPGNKPGATTCAALIRFVTIEDARFILQSFNGCPLPGFERPLSIAYATRAGQRFPEGSGPAALASALANTMMSGAGAMGGCGYGKAPVAKPAMLAGTQPYAKPEPSDNLYIKGIPGSADEDFVRQLFGQYGTVRTCKVLKKNGDLANCHALVRFGSAEEAANIISSLNGGMLEGFTTALEIAYAQDKSSMGWSGGADGGMAGMTGASGRHDPNTEQLLDEWVKAKRTRDYATADSVRAILRSQGVDPDTERPRAW